MRSNVYKFIVILLRFVKSLCLDRNFCQTVYDISPNRRFIICHQQYFLAFIVTPYLFKHFPSQHKCVQIADLSPANRFCNLCRCIIIARTHQRLHLIYFQLKLIFIHACHHLSKDYNPPSFLSNIV